MSNTRSNVQLVERPLVLVGPTASGKSAIGMELADSIGGVELVYADAMAVYREMNIGTAKPSDAEMAAVPHHMINTHSVAETPNVVEFATAARKTIDDLSDRGAVPVVLGGTGLYIRALIDDFDPPPAFPELRSELEGLDPDHLWEELSASDPTAASKIEPTNTRRIVRALEVIRGTGRRFSDFGPGVDHYPDTRFIQAGLMADRSWLDERIDRRFDAQVEGGLIDEVKHVLSLEPSPTAMAALGYSEIAAALSDEMTMEEAICASKARIKRFARRQERWFRRDQRIKWFDPSDPDVGSLILQHWVTEATKPTR